MEALGGVDVGEGLLEGLVVDAGEAVLVEVVAGGDDEVDVHLLPYHPHLQNTHAHTYTCHQSSMSDLSINRSLIYVIQSKHAHWLSYCGSLTVGRNLSENTIRTSSPAHLGC